MKHRINHLAVIISAAIYFVIGAFWYSPMLFVNTWLHGLGKTMEEMQRTNQGSPAPYVIGFLCDLIVAYAIAWFVNNLGEPNVFRGVFVAFVLWVGIAAPDMLMHGMFEGYPLSFFAVNTGYTAVGMLLTGIIVGAWPKKSSEPKPIVAKAGA